MATMSASFPNPQRCDLPKWTQVAVAVDVVSSQVQSGQIGRAFRERLDDTQLVEADVQVDKVGGFGYS